MGMPEMQNQLDEMIKHNEDQRDMCHNRKQFEMALSFSQHVETLTFFKSVFEVLYTIKEEMKKKEVNHEVSKVQV